MYNPLFLANFGSPPIPDDMCKDSATRHASVLEKKIFKGFFPIQKQREAKLDLAVKRSNANVRQIL